MTATIPAWSAGLSTPSYGLVRAPGQIVFGEGCSAGLGDLVTRLGTRVLVCTDRRMGDDPAFRSLVDSLTRAGATVTVYTGVESELPVPSIEACVDRLGAGEPDVIVGVGGGSSMDFAKALAVLLTHGGSLRDYYGELRVPGPTYPVVAVPTTAGTGSEVTPVAVVTDPDQVLKVGIASPYLIPAVAVVDPVLTYGCPPALTAHTGADALAHCVEAFTAVRRPAETAALATSRVFVGKTVLTDLYALAGIELIARSLRRAASAAPDDEARRDMALAALYGGLAFGTAGTAAAHALQYPIGALTHTSHGEGVGLLLPFVMAYNASPELATVAAVLGADDAVTAVRQLMLDVGIRPTLADLGLRADQIDWVAASTMRVTRLLDNNPRPVGEAAARAIVAGAFAGDLSLGGTA
ncbi:iron-containing alcohol dehydrogenase [Dactylosporangium sp. NPDC005572]|uniref:iron-containing alcohol dehydrogenase n=1 Tax=Dactylosporangium sp. NPDC005572 TaxID=3156889 RepID=UPI0033A0D4E4